MNLLIRPAIISDIIEMAKMADQKRRHYEQWQPLFHRPAADAKARHSAYLSGLLHHENSLLLVAEDRGTVLGFLLGEFRNAPPVYEPGGQILLVDDFVVREEPLWPTIGAALLKAAKERARGQGAVLANVVCGPKDQAKRRVLEAEGLGVASEWWVGEL